MRISNMRIVAFASMLFCFDLIAMLMQSPHHSPSFSHRPFDYPQQKPDGALQPKIRLSPNVTQKPKYTVSMFDLSAFLLKPSVNVSGVIYPVFLSDDLMQKLEDCPAFKDKLVERLREIQQRDYSKSPIKINNFSLYLSEDKKEVYSMAFTESDW